MSAIMGNATSILSRRPKVTLALGIAALLLLISALTPAETLKSQTHKIIQSTPFSTPYTFRGQAVYEDAHLLDDADDFLPHFKAVVEYPSMPISDAKVGCGWPDESLINLQWGYDASRGDDFQWIIEDEDDYKIELIRKQWQYFVANEMRPWGAHKKRFHGKGIVVPAGHEKSLARTKIILHMLNKVGSALDVEIAYWGDNELKDDSKQQLLAIRQNIFFNDLEVDQPIPTFYSALNNFHLKIPAVINSRFAEVILLDSDNIPVIDPAILFDSEVYKEFGTVFWPDIVRTRRQNPIWAITNTQCRMDEWEQESGQLLVDKRKFWYHLQLATWFETEHRMYYEKLILGDKDMFRFAWHALKTKFGVPSRWITSVGTLSPPEPGKTEEFYCGHTFAQHHPDVNGSIAFLHGGLLKTLRKENIAWHLQHQGGIFQAYKRTDRDQDKHFMPHVRIEWDPAHYLTDADKGEDYLTPWCTNLPGDAPHPLDELLPGFQETYKEIGGYWMLDGWTGPATASSVAA